MDGGAATERNIHVAFDDIGAGDPAVAVVLLHGLFGIRPCA